MPRPITRTGASGSHDDDECPNPPPMPSTMADAIAALVNATAENARLLRELAQNQLAKQLYFYKGWPNQHLGCLS